LKISRNAVAFIQGSRNTASTESVPCSEVVSTPLVVAVESRFLDFSGILIYRSGLTTRAHRSVCLVSQEDTAVNSLTRYSQNVEQLNEIDEGNDRCHFPRISSPPNLIPATLLTLVTPKIQGKKEEIRQTMYCRSNR
jgi:hypothetical protein